jgi:hypothetical protein
MGLYGLKNKLKEFKPDLFFNPILGHGETGDKLSFTKAWNWTKARNKIMFSELIIFTYQTFCQIPL